MIGCDEDDLARRLHNPSAEDAEQFFTIAIEEMLTADYDAAVEQLREIARGHADIPTQH